jgi:hypothetical protein
MTGLHAILGTKKHPRGIGRHRNGDMPIVTGTWSAFALTGLRRDSLRYDMAPRAEIREVSEGWWARQGSNL